MTRYEQIIKASWETEEEEGAYDIILYRKAFIEGAKWADKHPSDAWVDKAVEWMSENIRPFIGYKIDFGRFKKFMVK